VIILLPLGRRLGCGGGSSSFYAGSRDTTEVVFGIRSIVVLRCCFLGDSWIRVTGLLTRLSNMVMLD